jgi:hypothetical protein
MPKASQQDGQYTGRSQATPTAMAHHCATAFSQSPSTVAIGLNDFNFDQLILHPFDADTRTVAASLPSMAANAVRFTGPKGSGG